MFLPFYETLRAHGVPVSLREYLSLLEAVDAGCADYDIDAFYALARAILVKREGHIDRFDRAFAAAFNGAEGLDIAAALEARGLPEDWLRREIEKHLTDAEKAGVEGAGSFEKLMEMLKQRLAEQQKRHQGGSKWIGTGGTSPFGAYGYNPEGVRIGQDRSRHQRAVKVWDKREFRDFDDQAEIGTRAMKVALRRLKNWAREGAEELDLDGTVSATARSGLLDVKLRPERRNAVKVLLFLDVGGSMDAHVAQVEELFSAARGAFARVEHFYFHNCLYEFVWRNNRRRWSERTLTRDVLNTYGRGWKCVFVGDAAMSPYEIAIPGGAGEHWNEEAGQVWLRRAGDQWPDHLWINPVRRDLWRYTQSTAMIRDILGPERMVPLTLDGLTEGMRVLS